MFYLSRALFNCLHQSIRQALSYPLSRSFADISCRKPKHGLLLGCFECGEGENKLSDVAHKFDCDCGGRIAELLKGTYLTSGKAMVCSNIHEDYYAVAVACVGPQGAGYSQTENLDLCKENIRAAAGVGAQALQKQGAEVIDVECFTNTEAAAEGATLGVWRYQELKNPDDHSVIPALCLYNSDDTEEWNRGVVKADAQNTARRLEEAPPNLMTPANFSQEAIEILCPLGVNIEIRNYEWLENRKMTAFLAMARGSCESPPLLMELSYCGGSSNDKPVVLVGKGVTFDSGGLCLKPCHTMMEYRGDMAGAAVIVAVLKAVATMNLPININALIPLCENMPGGMAVKPGDVVMGYNGKTIQIENPDHDGRIILADVLSYTATFDPCLIINIATLTNGVRKALGSSSSGVFTTSDHMWKELSRAGADTGDRVWRFPLWKHYSYKIKDNVKGADLNNVGAGFGGGPCSAAAFLMEFVPDVDFCHLDITGTGLQATGINFPYLKKNLMTGRPTRTLIQFLNQMACPLQNTPEC